MSTDETTARVKAIAERWKTIAEFPSYEVSDRGRVSCGIYLTTNPKPEVAYG